MTDIQTLNDRIETAKNRIETAVAKIRVEKQDLVSKSLDTNVIKQQLDSVISDIETYIKDSN